MPEKHAEKHREQLCRYIAGEDVSLAGDEWKERERVDAQDAREFVAGDMTADELELDTTVVAALVAHLVETQNAAKLAELASGGDKALIKEARRGVHRLRSRGVDVTVDRAPWQKKQKLTAAVETPEAWAAPPDGSGERLLAVIAPAAGRGYHVIYVHVSDEQGLLDVVASRGPKKLWRDLKRRFDERRLLFAPVAPGYAAHLIDASYERTVSMQRTPPRQFAQIGPVLSEIRTDKEFEHPALTQLTAKSPTPAESEALHELAEVKGWSVPRDSLRALGRKFDEIQSSQILVDDEQRVKARRDALNDALVASFDEAGKNRWRGRFLDAAYVYHQGGHKAEASHLRALADDIMAEDFDPLAHPFTRRMVEKLVSPDLLAPGSQPAAAAQAPGAPEENLIVAP